MSLSCVQRVENTAICGLAIILLTLLLSTAYTTWGVEESKRRLSDARRNAWAGGMLYRDSVSLTPLIQVFRGRPLALRPLNHYRHNDHHSDDDCSRSMDMSLSCVQHNREHLQLRPCQHLCYYSNYHDNNNDCSRSMDMSLTCVQHNHEHLQLLANTSVITQIIMTIIMTTPGP